MVFFEHLAVQTVCKADRDNPRNSEASILELRDGRLLLAWQRYEKSSRGSEDNAPSAIWMMDSSDLGRSWDNPRQAVSRLEGCVNVYSPNLLRLKDGGIALLFMRYMQLEAGKPPLTNAYWIRSDDEGNSWSQESLVWERTHFTFSNDCILRLSSGRVVVPLCYCDTPVWSGEKETSSVTAMVSDDDCLSWRISDQQITLPMRGAMEPFCAECGDGSLLMVMRTQLGSIFRSYSHDSGLHWTKPQTTGLSAPESCPYVTRIPGTTSHLVIWNHAEYDMHFYSHYGKRTPLTVAVTSDNGSSFQHFFNVESDPDWAYSNPGVTWVGRRCYLTYWAVPYTPEGSMAGLIDLKLASFDVVL